MSTRNFMEFEETKKALDWLCKIIDNLKPSADSSDFNETAFRLYDSIFNDITVIDMKIWRLKYMLEAEWMLTLKEADKKLDANYNTLESDKNKIEEVAF